MLCWPGRIPIKIHPVFWLFAALIGFFATLNFIYMLIWVIVILVSVLVHEFGHALTAKAFDQRARIELIALGGLTFHEGKKLKLWQDFVIVLIGPLAGLVLCGITYFLVRFVPADMPILLYILLIFVRINLFWSLINLLPVLPLDGGQLLRIIMEGIFGFRGLKITLFVGVVLGIGIGIGFFYFGALLIGAIFLLLAFESFTSWKYFKHMTSEDKDTTLIHSLEEGEKDLIKGNTDEALKEFEELRKKSQRGLIYIEASEKIAYLLEQKGERKAAYDILKELKEELSGEGRHLLHCLAYHNKDYILTLELGKRCFQDFPTHNVALINALVCASLDQTKPAIGWLECAIREGLPTISEVFEKKEFDKIRENPTFQAFMKNYHS